ncbi:hypothetical protein SAMN05444506_12358 [Pseudomonas syringae]|uniref:SRPBCC family protein n=1 Tax=Pseudomonas syringae group TaxID=136849 RepID=UPI000896520F|nr:MULTISPECIES: carbon monoxide dehydrogenase subunit G [Pseudomonas syringae group]RMN56896.1 hypothetical protein ALQ58_200000 [Pseudomonas syringae pv. apii]SDZ51511.1 hypothetical protein SAMN05444506_12358 [Pseudomonas syringae]
MQLNDEQILNKPRAEVWSALNNPEVLKRSIPGCDTFEAEGENKYRIGLVVAVGPIKARFNGRLEISDIEELFGYSLTFEGSGGTAGFGKGTAKVKLADTEAGTLLSYAVDAEVGGKLAQVGSRLIDGVARRKAKEFFGGFSKQLNGGQSIKEIHEASDIKLSQNQPEIEAGKKPESMVRKTERGPIQGRTESANSQLSTISLLAASVAVLGASVAVLAAAVVIGFGLR